MRRSTSGRFYPESVLIILVSFDQHFVFKRRSIQCLCYEMIGTVFDRVLWKGLVTFEIFSQVRNECWIKKRRSHKHESTESVVWVLDWVSGFVAVEVVVPSRFRWVDLCPWRWKLTTKEKNDFLWRHVRHFQGHRLTFAENT